MYVSMSVCAVHYGHPLHSLLSLLMFGYNKENIGVAIGCWGLQVCLLCLSRHACKPQQPMGVAQ